MQKNKQNGAQAGRQSRLQLRYRSIDTKTIDRNICGNLLVFAQCLFFLDGIYEFCPISNGKSYLRLFLRRILRRRRRFVVVIFSYFLFLFFLIR